MDEDARSSKCPAALVIEWFSLFWSVNAFCANSGVRNINWTVLYVYEYAAEQDILSITSVFSTITIRNQ